jgi:molecular chaperone HscB
LLEEIGKAKLSLEEKQEALSRELKAEWAKWDETDSTGADAKNDPEQRKILDKMVDVLNRRNYIRNLVRDVNEAME